MANLLDRLPYGSRAAIIRLRSLGDSVLTTPAIEILKAARPDLQLAVVSEARFFPVFEGNACLSAVLPPSARALRRFRPLLCLNLHGGGTSARLTALSGARFRAGFGHFPHRFVYNLRIPRAQQILGEERPVHTAEHLASAMFYLGAPRVEIPRARLSADRGLYRHPVPYAVLHPFASQPAKTWPVAFFLKVAHHLKRELDLQPVFLSGPGEDLSPFQMWPTLANAPLDKVKSAMAGAALFLGNDSGPAHLAAAFGVPVVAIFGPSNPIAWAPWRTSSEVLLARGPIHSVQPEKVMQALDKLRVHA